MTDQERILKLLEDGKISREQAEGLLEALDEADSLSLEGNLALKRDTLATKVDRLAAANDELLEKLERLAVLKERGIEAEVIDELVKSRSVDERLLQKLERIASLRERGIEIGEKDLLELDRGRYGEIVRGSVVVSKELRDEIAKKPLEIDPSILEIDPSVLSRILPIPPVPPIPPIPPIPPTFPFTQRDDLPNDIRWIRVNVLSGDVDINVNPKVKTIQVEAEEGANVQQDEDGNWTVTLKNDDLSLEIPEGFGVMLNVKSGDVSAQAPVIRGNVMSGDVSLEDVESLNLVVMSGDVDATLKLKKGKHDLRVSSGDVSLDFQEDASVSYQGSAYSGDVYISYPEGDFNSENTSFEGKIGEGAGQFLLEVQSGEVYISIEGEGSSVASKAKTKGKGSKAPKPFDFNFDFDKKFDFNFDFSKKSVKEPDNLRWLAIRCLSGDVSLKTQAGLSEPKIIEGGQAQKKENGDLRIFSLSGDVEVVLPEDYGVRLDVLSGDLEASGVAYVKGRVWSGDAKLGEVRGVNLLVMAGDAKAELLLTENEHSLDVWSGDANVEILSGSSVKTKGSTLAGDKRVETHDPNAFKSIDNQHFEVITKGGTAQFSLSVKAGDLFLETHDD
jgi:DUF4097 and DUF4098 domain-containing protein YvlB